MATNAVLSGTTTNDAPGCPPAPAPITCIQPGGGFGYRLAQALGGLRRAVNAIVRPGRGRRVEGCPHRVWSARDLFWHRNRCPDDPFNVSQLVFSQGPFGLARPGIPEAAFAYVVLGVLLC